jgi:hypothetical protein
MAKKHEDKSISKIDDDKALETSRSSHPDIVNSRGARSLFLDHWQWWAAAIIIVVLGAFPVTRYAVVGPFIKSNVTITVDDSQIGTSVSKATVTIDGKSVETNAAGQAKISSNVGFRTLTVTKQYYRTFSTSELVSLSQNTIAIKLVPLGRLVSLTVINKITGQPVSGIQIKVLDTSAMSGSNGVANIVLPPSPSTQKAALSGNGYNSTTAQIQVVTEQVPANTITVTPSGKIYFLSNLSGNIDVAKTNLDGTDRQTVLAGTGNEDPQGTSLLAARDWKYLALLSKRNAGDANPSLYLIDTSNDSVSTIDTGNASFQSVGWVGDRFIYEVYKSDSGSTTQTLKSYDAVSHSITVLTQAITYKTGSGGYYFGTVSQGQSLSGVYIINGQVMYTEGWSESNNEDYYSLNLKGKQNTINLVNADGSDATVVHAFNLNPQIGYANYGPNFQSYVYDEPNSIYVSFGEYGQVPSYYVYENGQWGPDTDATNPSGGPYPTYLLSPAGDHTLWTKYADGQNIPYIGDPNANNAKIVSSASGYSAYGWYTDNYILVSQNSSSLYIMKADGSGKPFKITNYYKSQLDYNGYGAGYGGQ